MHCHESQFYNICSETNGHIQNESHLQTVANGKQKDDDGSTQTKRRPGRPRGSKNRTKGKAKNFVSNTSVKSSTPHNPPAFQQPVAHSGVNADNQQYYEFQWRVLNLCAEFYGAAEELVVSC